MTELVQFGVIKDLRGELRKYDEKLLRLDPFSRLTSHHFTEYRRVRPLDLESRWAFFYQKHGIEKGQELCRIAQTTAFAYSDWPDQADTLPYYAYAARTLNRRIEDITPPSLVNLERSNGTRFPPLKSELDQMVEAVATQAELTQECITRMFQVREVPLFRNRNSRDLFRKGVLYSFRDTSPNRLIFSGSLSRNIPLIKTGRKRNVVRQLVPVDSVFDCWLSNPLAFYPAEDDRHGAPTQEYEIRYLHDSNSSEA